MSESSIDEDRMMQGIDDSDSHIQITWTNCDDADVVLMEASRRIMELNKCDS